MAAKTADALSKAPADSGEHIDPDEGHIETRSVGQQWLEYTLVCLCNISWRIDSSILPMFYPELQKLFNVSQTELSMLNTAKGLTAALFAFPCGFMAELLPRPMLIGLGMIFWAIGLAMCAVAWSFEMVFIGRVLNGIGLGVVQPLLLSLVADQNPPTRRGSAFGSIFFVGLVGNTIFGLVATSSAATDVLGVAGWRVSVGFVALFSAAVGMAMLMVVIEPNAPYLAGRRRQEGFLPVFKKGFPKILQLFERPTFVLILCQGAPGTAPWTVFPFFTQWLELLCFSHAQAAMVFSAFNWGQAFSCLLGGGLLSLVARRFPDMGPPSIGSCSVASGIPFLVLFFFVLPNPMDHGDGVGFVLLYSLVFFFFGLGIEMAVIVNNKVFADIVPSHIFTYVFAIDQLVENGLGNLVGLAVGVLTDRVFHYDRDAAKSGQCDPEEGHKLGMGMFVVCNVAWAICLAVYLGMHCTYPRDRRRQLLLQRREQQTLQKWSDSESTCTGSSASASELSPHLPSQVQLQVEQA